MPEDQEDMTPRNGNLRDHLHPYKLQSSLPLPYIHFPKGVYRFCPSASHSIYFPQLFHFSSHPIPTPTPTLGVVSPDIKDFDLSTAPAWTLFPFSCGL